MSGIYIHIPFCKQACHYCDFHFSTSLKKRDEMVLALAKEIELRKDEFQNITVETIYFGGGTPSLLKIEELRFLIDEIRKNYNISDNPEITLEANPDDLIFKSQKGIESHSELVEASQECTELSVRAQSRITFSEDVTLSAVEESQKEAQCHSELVEESQENVFKDYKSIGINRLSIGIQSFFEDDLKLMNRAHNAKEAKECLSIATRHFDNISVDLIYGIQNSTNKKWLQNIETALSFGIPHVSSYALTVEPKTALASFIKKGIIDDVDDELAHEQFHILKDKLEKEGFVHYELSNFGKQGFFSQNNTAYWQGKTYIGIGPSAHSFNGKQRGWNVRNNSKYITSISENKLPIEIENLSNIDRYNEYVMTGLRTMFGVSLEKVESNFGADYKDYLLEHAQVFINQHLLYIEKAHLKATKEGQFLTDGISSELFKINTA